MTSDAADWIGIPQPPPEGDGATTTPEPMPQFVAVDTPPGEEPPEFGTPDHRKSRDRTEPIRKLGTNKKARSPVRALTNADEDKLAALYVYVGFGILPFNQRVGKQFGESAETCAKAWRELAATNDTVRRALLGILEGGAWGAVIMAHMPIIVACLPENARNALPFLNAFPAEGESAEQ